jgi:hypothetical protein
VSVSVRRELRTYTEFTPDERDGLIYLTAARYSGAVEPFDMGRTVKVIRTTEEGEDDTVEVFVTFPTNARSVYRLVSAQPNVLEFLEQYAPEALARAGKVEVIA